MSSETMEISLNMGGTHVRKNILSSIQDYFQGRNRVFFPLTYHHAKTNLWKCNFQTDNILIDRNME